MQITSIQFFFNFIFNSHENILQGKCSCLPFQYFHKHLMIWRHISNSGILAAKSLAVKAGSVIRNFYDNLYLICLCVLSHVWIFATPGTVAHQASLSMGFSQQEYWKGLPFPSPEDLLDPGIEPVSFASPALAGRFFTTMPPGSSYIQYVYMFILTHINYAVI